MRSCRFICASMLGVDDSKVLKEEKREEIFARISNPEDSTSECFGYVLKIYSAQYLSNQMLKRTKCSLNEISHSAAMDMIQDCLDAGILVENVRGC